MARKQEATLEQELIRRLQNLEQRVGAIEEHTTHNMRLKPDEQRAFIDEVFGRGKRLAQVFLATSRQRSVNNLAEHIGMKRQNVTIAVAKLQDAGLVKVDVVGANNYYVKTQVASTIGAAQMLMKKFKLTKDGLPRANAT